MLSGTNSKTGFAYSGNELAWQMNLKGAKSDKSAERGRKEFMESAKLSHAQLEDKKNEHGLFPFISLARYRFYNGVLKDCRLTHASEKIHLHGHTDTTRMINSNLSHGDSMIEFKDR